MQTATVPYPVRVEGHLDEPLNRWLWLVKWLLALPHWIILLFLWLAFWVVTVIAFFAILITGRYPQGLFDFNVGVARWSWRVVFYAFVLGTDRYPPFSLSPDPGYPAGLDVAHADELSRGLVLVKWWLLAIPHYLIIAIFSGSGITLWGGARDSGMVIGGGIIGGLALIAGILLAISTRYPRPLFEVLMGFQRWIYRVLAYAGLMRDEYPPFRLDVGGPDPGTATVPAAPAAPTTGAPTPGPTGRPPSPSPAPPTSEPPESPPAGPGGPPPE
jgi:hypothetical protein